MEYKRMTDAQKREAIAAIERMMNGQSDAATFKARADGRLLILDIRESGKKTV